MRQAVLATWRPLGPEYVVALGVWSKRHRKVEIRDDCELGPLVRCTYCWSSARADNRTWDPLGAAVRRAVDGLDTAPCEHGDRFWTLVAEGKVAAPKDLLLRRKVSAR